MSEGFTRRDAAAYLAAAVLAAALVFVASILVPRPEGTHQQLGLPDCAFQMLTRLPCPSCGLTTCFALMARGELGRALAVQPFGALLFGATLLAIPAAALLAAARVPVRRALGHTAARWAQWTLFAAYLAGWAYKLSQIPR